MNKNVRYLTQAAVIAALYSALVLATTLLMPLGFLNFGNVQLRLSEALTVLPYFTPAAVPGLFVGCLISNIVGATTGAGVLPLDVVFGSLATLAAALCSRALRGHKWLVPIPPIVVNAVVVGLLLTYVYHLKIPLLINILSVGAGQAIACYGLGMPLLLALEKRKGMFN